MDDLDWVIYGYKGHRWMRIVDRHDKFYGLVPEEFDVEKVVKVREIWKDSNYCDDLRGYEIYWNNGCESFKVTDGCKWWNEQQILPYSDHRLYKLVDDFIELAHTLNISTDLYYEYENYNFDEVVKLSSKISKHVEDNVRLTKLLEGTDLLTLIKKLDESNIKNDELIDETKSLINLIDSLRKQLSVLGTDLKKEKARNSQLEAEVARLTAERNSYKKEMLEKLKKALD